MGCWCGVYRGVIWDFWCVVILALYGLFIICMDVCDVGVGVLFSDWFGVLGILFFVGGGAVGFSG